MTRRFRGGLERRGNAKGRAMREIQLGLIGAGNMGEAIVRGILGAAVLQADAVALPVASGTLDALFTGFTLELLDVPDIARCLAECSRVLRPGGRLCVVALSKGSGDPPMVRLYEWAHRRFPAAIDCRPIHVARALAGAGFDTARHQTRSLFGLPVAVALARKPAISSP